VTADANGDGLITSADAATVARNFGLRSGASWADGDFDLDGTVGLKDLMTLQRAGLSLGGGPTTVQAALAQHAVPEPGAVTLASMAFACLSASCLMRRRKRHSPHQPLRN
jgi:hypothetical protein